YDSGYLTQQSIYTPESYAHSFRQGRGPSLARKTVIRKGGGETWEDPTLLEWDPSHFRLFVGDLANDVSDDLLRNAFGAQRYPSFVKAKVVRDKSTNKSRGFGFVSYTDPEDFMKAWKEMDGKYVGSRPVKIKKATTQVGAVNIGAKKARDLDSKKKQ
ncbi:RNA-binding domain-containing protein, partial [Atractiella rhizophila]